MTSYPFLEYPPPDGTPRPWPLVLFLHGSGERGNDLQRVATQGLPQRAQRGDRFPFLLVAPQCPRRRWWSIAALAELLDGILLHRPVDRDRVVLTGVSMGADATWALALRQPERFAAVVPVCGTGDPRRAHRLRDVPVWTFHGARDDIVPIQDTVKMVAALREAGAEVRFTVFPDTDHDAWTPAYATDDLYPWMLAQHRRAPP